MFVLDTDHISLIDRGGAEGRRILGRMSGVRPDQICATIVSFEEQVRGWMAVLPTVRDPLRQVRFYSQLQELLRYYSATPLLPFDDTAASLFVNLRSGGVRIGPMDLKIAAIALANAATLLTRNHSDFGRVPGLRIEDWSI